MTYLRHIAVFCVFAVQVQSEQCVTPNKESGKCVYLHTCQVLLEAATSDPDASVQEFIQKSICGGNKFAPMVCCGSSANFTPTEEISSTFHNKTSLLPGRKYCGYQHSDDYFRQTNDTSVRINEFPWLAYILHRHKPSGRNDFRCSGSLINRKYVLTAAYCLTNPNFEIKRVRLGEYHLPNRTDCIQEPPFDQECSDVQDYGIDKVIPHPNYSQYANDIGLIRLNRSVEYSDYIRPICLPQPGTTFAEVDDLLTSSGWGTTVTGHRADVKKKVVSTVITNEECSTIFAEENITLTENQLCISQLINNTDVICTSDSGGPVMSSHNLQWHQEGITAFGRGGPVMSNKLQWHIVDKTSFGPGFCGQQNYPDVATRVLNYIEWIEESLEP